MPRGNPGKPRPYQRHRKTIRCENCKTLFDVPMSTPRRYCGVECYKAHNHGENHPQFRDMKVTTQGYIGCTQEGKRLTQHRIIAAKALGRPLKRNEVVHHIDGNKLNNANSNLLVCTVGYHQWLHMRMSLLYAQEKFGVK